MKKELVAHQDPKSPISEIFRTLRTNIQFMNTKGKLKSILITSTMPGEGKSWVASNLAVTFAQAGKTVILIDADMRKGRLYSIFDISPRPGLSNFLSGVDWGQEDKISENIEDYVQETQIENLFVLAAGNVPPNPSELLVSDEMLDLMKRLETLCDIIIFDGTPSQLVTDSLILARIVDSTVIVTASKETKKDDLKRVIKNIKNVGGKIAGVVINKIPIDAKKYEQSYYYGSTSLAETKPKSRAAKKASEEMYNRASNIIERKEEPVEEEIIKDDNNEGFEEIKEIEENINEENEEEQSKIETLTSKLKMDKAEELPLDKTAEILSKISAYLDEEKKKLNE